MNKSKSSMQKASRLSAISIPIALAISISMLLIGFNVIKIDKAFADATITVVTPTGGNLISTSDCLDISAGGGIIWLNCNSILYAISESTNTVIANITDATITNHQSCQAGQCVIAHDNIAADVVKYNLEATTILQTSRYNAPCVINADIEYDDAGFMWSTCAASDQIVRLNPNSFNTQTLADTTTCDSPDHVAYNQVDNIGIMHCQNGGAADSIVSFSRASATAITLLDTEVTASGTTAIMIDGSHNRILAPSTANMFVWSYTAGGILTLEQTLTGNSLDRCAIEPFAIIESQALNILCSSGVSPETIISGYLSNSTGVFPILNSAIAFINQGGIGLDLTGGTDGLPIWYISANQDNQKYIKVVGLRTLEDVEPVPPVIGGTNGTNIINGIDCDLPERVNTVLCANAGGAIVNAGAFVVGEGSEGTGISGIACNLGFTDCVANPDIKTNGTGYLFFIGGIALMMGLFLVISKGNLLAIPTFIWIIATLSLAGAMALMQIIDPVIFIITIVAVIALAVPKIVSTISGNTTLGAGNTS